MPEIKKRILLVDDSRIVHQVYGAHLTQAGYDVLHAQDGIAGINLAFTEQPDLIVLDIHMPSINGYQVCRLLKDHPATRDIPVVITTGTRPEGISSPEQWSFRTGADGYIEKNLNGPILREMQPFLDRPTGPPRTKYPPLTELDILFALSNLLDKQLYDDVTRLSDLNERKNAFVSNVSHEFRSPLAVLRGYVQSVREGVLGPVLPEQAKVLDISLREIGRLTRLVNDLLDLSKIEAGKMTLAHEPIDLQALLEEVMETYAGQMQESTLVLESRFPSERLWARGDKDRLAQTFINILSNSIKYTPPHGRIQVSLSAQNGAACVTISDTGPGIPADHLEKIFDKFERVTAEKQEGTGLGLPIARDIVVLHGGKLWAESSPGKGSTFIALLPLPIPLQAVA